MNEEKIKIIEAKYDEEKDLAKIKVLKVDTAKEVTWALLGDDFDSLIAQMTGMPLQYYSSQRKLLCEVLKNKEFINRVEFDIDNTDLSKTKDKSRQQLLHGHDAVDRYPFYEIQQEALEESMQGTEDEINES